MHLHTYTQTPTYTHSLSHTHTHLLTLSLTHTHTLSHTYTHSLTHVQKKAKERPLINRWAYIAAKFGSKFLEFIQVIQIPRSCDRPHGSFYVFHVDGRQFNLMPNDMKGSLFPPIFRQARPKTVTVLWVFDEVGCSSSSFEPLMQHFSADVGNVGRAVILGGFCQELVVVRCQIVGMFLQTRSENFVPVRQTWQRDVNEFVEPAPERLINVPRSIG